jgi:hypothetical protein
MILDLILAAQMRGHIDLQGRLAARGISKNDLQVALRSAKDAGVIQRRVQPSELIAYIGRPNRDDPECLSYDLTLWPEHRFDFGIHEGGWILYRGFAVKQDVASVAVPTLLSEGSARQAFRLGFHTRVHVQEVMGPAHIRQGWNGMEDLFYPADTDPMVVFEFDFGLLTGISARTPIVM